MNERVRRIVATAAGVLLLVLGACSEVVRAPAPAEPEIAPAAKLTLGGMVWEDLDRDGLMEVDEPPMAGVSVELLDASAAAFDPAVLTATGPDGRYVFAELASGTYHVAFSRPDGYEFSRPDRGDSDANLLGVAGPIELGRASISTQAVEVDLTIAGVSPEPILVSGNTNCADLNRLNDDFPRIISDFGFKVEGYKNGTYTLTNPLGELTGGAPPDPNNSVTISNSNGTFFDWAATLGIDAVIVKGGNGVNAYVYTPEAFGDANLHAPEIDPEKDQYYEISHIEFCYDYELDVTKDAATSFTRTYTWDITKSPDGEYDLFTGDEVVHRYTVAVDRTGVTDSDWAVAGTITIANDTPLDATITGVTDVVSSDITATVDCGVVLPYTLAAGGNLTCAYSADLPDATTRLNTATVATTGVVLGGQATADVDFATATMNEVHDEVTVTDTNAAFAGPKTISDDASWSYDATFACDTDEGEHVNTAKVLGDGGTELGSDTATVDLDCYALNVAKTAVVESYTQEYDWTIAKGPDGDYDLFTGDEVVHKYTISITRGELLEESWFVTGTITVSNAGNPIPAEITGVADVISGTELTNVSAIVDCGEVTGPHSIAAGGTLECTYEATIHDADYGLNTATATQPNFRYTGAGFAPADPVKIGTTNYSGTAVVDASGVTPTILPVYVEDDYATTDPTDDLAYGPYTASDSESYERTFACDADEGSYVNTASLLDGDDELIDSDTAQVTVDCYALVVTKDAAGTYDERHTWDIEKSVDPTSKSGYPGDELSWTWTVTLSETFVDENFALTGTITISNAGNPIPAEITDLTDVLSGAGLTAVVASVDCGTTATSSYSIAAGSSLTCTYDAGTTDLRAYATNTATATLQNYTYYGEGYDPTPADAMNGTTDFSGSAAVRYTKDVINETATVDDDQETDFPLTLDAGDGPWSWTETQKHVCSSDRADYGEDGTYSSTLDNTATVTGSDGQYDEAMASTTYTCEATLVEIHKTTNGAPADPTKDIRFDLYDGTVVLETVTTLGHGSEMGFDTALVPYEEYTICESPVPAGYTFEITVNGGNVLTYAGPPGEANPTGEIQCFDFIATPAASVITFQIENSYPGGQPRTPGYWKNWNTCSGGNQAATAAALGGTAEGVFLLDDLLPQPLGDLMVDLCEDGVLLLDARDLTIKATNRASDAAYALARSLLAARLNQDAGACVVVGPIHEGMTFEQVLTRADAILTQVHFDGTGSYLDPKTVRRNATLEALRSEALALTYVIDAYNNGEYCDL